MRIYSLRQVNELPDPTKEEIYRRLLPNQLLEDFGIDPETLCDAQGNRLVRFTCPHGSGIVEVDVRSEVGFPDPLLYVELSDTRLNQIEVILFVVNDPSSERFETDRDWRGERTMFGTFRRFSALCSALRRFSASIQIAPREHSGAGAGKRRKALETAAGAKAVC